MNSTRRRLDAFTMVELVTMLAVFGLLATLVLPALARTQASVGRIYCSNNLKQTGIAFQNWGAQHGSALPMRVAAANGGYADFIGLRSIALTQASARGVFGIFRAMSNELVTPKILICPSENEPRTAADTFSSTVPIGSTYKVPFTNDLNVSYFVGVDAVETAPRMFLSGDHNLGADGNLVPFVGFVTAPTTYHPNFAISVGTNFAPNAGVGWLDTMHRREGNVLLMDGSVQQFNRDELQQALQNSGDRGNFQGPFVSPAGCSGAGINRLQFP